MKRYFSSERAGRRLDSFAILAAQTANKDYADRTSDPIRQSELGSNQGQQRKPFALFRKQIDGIILEHVRGRSTRQQPHKPQRELVLDGVQVFQKLLSVDLLNIHGSTQNLKNEGLIVYRYRYRVPGVFIIRLSTDHISQ
jgi:hypothetical protein